MKYADIIYQDIQTNSDKYTIAHTQTNGTHNMGGW